MRLGLLLTSMLVIVGCGDFDDGTQGPVEETDTLLPPPDEPAPGSVPLGDPCSGSEQCVEPGICAAAWDGEEGALVCTDVCIPTDDATQWCADDDACCDVDAICSARGLCQMPVAVDESGGDTGPVGTGSVDGTAGSDGSSTGMASSGSEGSSEGASSGTEGGSSGTG